MPQSPPSPPPPPPPDLLLQTTTTNLTSLQTHLPNIHHFKSKWSLISSKLTSLHSLLLTLTLSTTPTPTLTTTILTSLSTTLTSAISTASDCSDPSPTPPRGKLLTQSEVDSLSSLLDQFLHDLSLLSNAPPAGNLITRLQIGSPDSKNAAIDELTHLLNSDDKNVLVAVSQGLLPVLIKILDSTTSFDIKEKVVSAIARVSSVESSKNALNAEGLGLTLLNQLIRVIESGTGFAKEKACVVLKELSLFKENARAIGSCGGISSLLEICDGGTPSSQGVAAAVLRNLARFEEIKENFVEEGAVSVLLALSRSGTAVARENAMGCLANLAWDDDTLKVVVVREGGVDSLKSYWDTTSVEKGLEPAVELLRNLASYKPIGEVLITQGFHTRFPALLNCGVMSVRVAAAGGVYELGFCSKARREMGECGCLAPLVRMLDGKAVEERESASKALSRILLCHCNRKAFRKEERGVVGLVQLLDPLANKNLDKKWSVAALATLVQSKKCRKLIVGAGACVYLEKLVELEVDGAKRLLESIGKGKLWGVFNKP